MEKLENQIADTIKLIEKMIKNSEEKSNIEEQREKLDELLNKYLSDFK